MSYIKKEQRVQVDTQIKELANSILNTIGDDKTQRAGLTAEYLDLNIKLTAAEIDFQNSLDDFQNSLDDIKKTKDEKIN